MSPANPVQPLLALLHQMRKTIERMDDITYAAPAPGRTSGGVGGHVRHCLDHIEALLAATRSGLCEYDRRRRGTDIETSRRAAVTRVNELTTALACVDAALLDSPVVVEAQLEPNGAMLLAGSTVGRELAFVMSHTIHHNALIAMLLKGTGVALDARFGLAPATPTDQPRTVVLSLPTSEAMACAR